MKKTAATNKKYWALPADMDSIQGNSVGNCCAISAASAGRPTTHGDAPKRVCGLDVYKDGIKACVRVPGQGKKRDQHTTEDILALRDWLEQWKITGVAMESTGEYWKPIYY